MFHWPRIYKCFFLQKLPLNVDLWFILFVGTLMRSESKLSLRICRDTDWQPLNRDWLTEKNSYFWSIFFSLFLQLFLKLSSILLVWYDFVHKISPPELIFLASGEETKVRAHRKIRRLLFDALNGTFPFKTLKTGITMCCSSDTNTQWRSRTSIRWLEGFGTGSSDKELETGPCLSESS